jgi:nanoRNase/pAp phosphatase (c-di-AMP/oligoRNAs hydrolase)
LVWNSFIETIKGNVGIITHHNSDPDAIGAAQGVKELIEKLKPDYPVEIIFPEGTSELSKYIINKLNLNIKEPVSKTYDTLIIADTGKISQLGKWEEKIKSKKHRIIIIDHHLYDEENRNIADYYINNPDAYSTSEMVYELFQENKLIPTVQTAKALLAGIVFDSKFFSLGNSKTFLTTSKLLKITGNISEIRDLMNLPMDFSEKIARLKAAERVKIHRIKDWIIVHSQISSYQSSGARGLLSLGADLAIVTGKKNDKIRASLRSTNKFYTDTGIHTGNLASELGVHFNGSGSGHPTAAGFNGNVSLDTFLEFLLEILNQKIS